MIIGRTATVLIFSLLLFFVLAWFRALPPEAHFIATPNTGPVPVELHFTDQYLGDIDAW